MVVPPRLIRLRFWSLGWRVEPRYRPWVAEQVTHPHFTRRKALGMTWLLLFWVPAGLLAVFGEAQWLLLIGPIAVLFGAGLQARRPLPSAQVSRLLAYHGVTSDGRLVEPRSAWLLYPQPFGRAGLALFVAQLLLVCSGGAVLFDHYTAVDRCRSVPADTTDALRAALGRQVLNDPQPSQTLGVGATLSRLREVRTTFPGIVFVGARATASDGRDLGAAVWRVILPGATFRLGQAAIDAGNDLAHQLTPSTGYFPTEIEFGATWDREFGRALACSRDA